MTLTRRALLGTGVALSAAQDEELAFEPRGRIHIPVGVPNTLDTLKTFIEAEGCFSPGFGSYGVYFATSGEPKLPEATIRGLRRNGCLIPWVRWRAEELELEAEYCQVRRGESFLVGVRLQVRNTGAAPRRTKLIVAVRPLGPAGWPFRRLEASAKGDALLVDGRTALAASRRGTFRSGALHFDVALRPGGVDVFRFVCPVLPGRNAARHRWADVGQNAMVDTAELNPASGGIPQPDLGLDAYRRVKADGLFREAERFWEEFLSGIRISLPDPRWGESMRAILAHAALCMNEGAPDVAVVNYNVFNRDGVYVANMLQKSGQFGLAGEALDYFLKRPFNGRAYPEADNPGQVLWILGQQWLFARDGQWLRRVGPSVRKLAALIRYYRRAPGPHWVAMDSLDYGDALPAGRRKELRPGRCDGFHPEYTEAFDIAGLRAAAELAGAAGAKEEAAAWAALAEDLFREYDARFGSRLADKYGSYCVQWPCRLYPLEGSRAAEQFRGAGAQKPVSWRYFPLATAHQGLLSGNREAGCATIALHLEHEQMRGWYAFDEGGGSGSGSWQSVLTKWPHSKEKPGNNPSMAMPHGWAIAEFWLLLRDSLVLEDRGRLVLLGGVPPEWFRHPAGMKASGLRTWYGDVGFEYRYDRTAGRGHIRFSGAADPPNGFVVRTPSGDVPAGRGENAASFDFC